LGGALNAARDGGQEHIAKTSAKEKRRLGKQDAGGKLRRLWRFDRIAAYNVNLETESPKKNKEHVRPRAARKRRGWETEAANGMRLSGAARGDFADRCEGQTQRGNSQMRDRWTFVIQVEKKYRWWNGRLGGAGGDWGK